jgi:hypothetical protein
MDNYLLFLSVEDMVVVEGMVVVEDMVVVDNHNTNN